MSGRRESATDGRKGRKVAPQLLRDLRVVYATGGKDGTDADLTDGQKVLWGLLRKDPDKFVSKFQAAEDKFAAGVEKAKAAEKGKDGPTPAELDDGTKRVLPLLEAQLAKFKLVPGKPCRACGQTIRGPV
jgi:hypothetical protein